MELIIIATVSTVVSLALAAFHVEPVWVPYLSFSVSCGLFILALIFETKRSPKAAVWLSKRYVFIVILIAMLAVNFLGRLYEHVWDLSEAKPYTLRQETIDWLAKITEPVDIFIFLSRDDKLAPYSEWLKQQFSKYAKNFKVEIKNINMEVALANKYGVTQPGETVMVSPSNWVKVRGFNENTILSGLMKLLFKQDSVICFAVEHGEPDIEDPSSDGLKAAADLFGGIGYKVKALSISTEDSYLSSSCGVVVFISPKTAFSRAEEETFMRMLNEGVPLFMALDPPVSETLIDTLSNKGIKASGDMLVNPDNYKKKMAITDIIFRPLTSHQITSGLTQRLYIPQTQSFDVDSKKYSELLVLDSGQGYRLLKDKGPSAGTFIIAITAENDGKPNMVLFGSGRPFINKNLSFGDNANLLLNSVKWLLNEETVGNIKPHMFADTRLELSASELNWYKIFSFYIMPSLAFMFLATIWIIHRKS